jgi:putative endonuclease
MHVVHYCVYILYSLKDKGLYVGCSSNVYKRFEAHNRGNVQATAYRKPLVLIHTEEYASKADAFNRERFLKSLWGAREKRKILKNFLGRKRVLGPN